MMELLSPAGNVQKLEYCYRYGADAAYIGLKNFSLRVKADNFYEDEYKSVCELKKMFPGKALHCALNISFHNSEIDRLKSELNYFKSYPIDAFIVQDLGIVPILQKEFPNAALHLSTQASCMNREAVKVYKSLGFKRVVMGREASLEEIKEIKDAVPDMEIECFVHGAMCIAYSGRCLMSAYLNGRSAQEGFCSHTCRWDFDVLSSGLHEDTPLPYSREARSISQSGRLVLREHKRPDEYFPVYEGDNFTAVLSSKDLCMIDHLADLKNAGVDSLKIEGRMKSVYYVAMITRAYRKALDALEGKITDAQAKPFVDEMYNVSHRQFATGFYYSRTDADQTVSGESRGAFELAAQVYEKLSDEEEAKVFSKADFLCQKRKNEYDAMVPQARVAFDKAIEEHPDSHLPCVTKKEGWIFYSMEALNMIDDKSEVQFVSPSVCSEPLLQKDFELVNPDTGEVYRWVCANHPCLLYTCRTLEEGTLLRTRDTGKRTGGSH